MPIFSGTVAAGCEFWERASQQTLVTHAADHQHCAIGVHTHNLPNASPAQDKELGDVLAAMKGVGYVRDEEVAAIPVMKQSFSTVIYGPLESCSGQADVVLLFAHARQSLGRHGHHSNPDSAPRALHS